MQQEHATSASSENIRERNEVQQNSIKSRVVHRGIWNVECVECGVWSVAIVDRPSGLDVNTCITEWE